MDEFELIRRYFARAGDGGAGVVKGIGDDAALLSPTPGMQQVQAIDSIVEGVHFPDGCNAADIGYRVVAVNISDIAAMGAVPRWVTLSVSLTGADADWLESFSAGLFTACAEYEVTLVGGDTTSAPVLVATVNATGEVAPGQAILRSGARPGDGIYVTGTLGDAAAGRQGLESGEPSRELLWRFARPAARSDYGRRLAGKASAAIDVSDGLAGDLDKLMRASGTGAEIDLEALPLSPALQTGFDLERQRDFALFGGDDYELLFTCRGQPPDGGIVPVTRIGAVSKVPGLRWFLRGEPVHIEARGYSHF